MELTGDILINASRSKVWAALNDPEVLTRSIPGCEGVEVTSPTERDVRLAVKVGPVRAKFVGKIRMEDIRPDEGCTLHFQGSGGAAGMASGKSTVSLADEAEGTRLCYTAEAAVAGKLGQVGGRMIDSAAKQMADQFFTAFNQQLGTGEPAAAAPNAAGHASAPTGKSAAMSQKNNASKAPAAEGLRILWFVLGALSTGFGFWVATQLN